jgi:transcriptional regulator with XRE-family HTH domain
MAVFRSPRHQRLTELLIEKRRAAGLKQVEVAEALGRHQPFIANIESGQRRIDVLELLELAEAIGFDPKEILDELLKLPRT